MSKWYQHEEHGAIEAAIRQYRSTLDGFQPTNVTEDSQRIRDAADAGEILADRVEQALRSTDWRRVEAHEAGGGK